jgi:hypothetical protein
LETGGAHFVVTYRQLKTLPEEEKRKKERKKKKDN